MKDLHLKNAPSSSVKTHSAKSFSSPNTIPMHPSAPPKYVCFDRNELMEILRVYGRMVAAAEWRDYAIDMLSDRAVFSVFRRATEHPLYSIEKRPKLAKKQGAYSIVTPTGLILKRGHHLKTVLRVFDKKPKLTVC